MGRSATYLQSLSALSFRRRVFAHFRPGEEIEGVAPGITWCCLTGDVSDAVWEARNKRLLCETSITLGVLCYGIAMAYAIASIGMEPLKAIGAFTFLVFFGSHICSIYDIYDHTCIFSYIYTFPWYKMLWIYEYLFVLSYIFLSLFDQLGTIWFFTRVQSNRKWQRGIGILGTEPQSHCYFLGSKSFENHLLYLIALILINLIVLQLKRLFLKIYR